MTTGTIKADQMRKKESLSHSMFMMWRCIVAIAHADGLMHAEERSYLEKVFAGIARQYDVSADQKNALQADLVKAQNVFDLLPQINDPMFRGQLIYFGGLLARKDGILHPNEDQILKKLHADHMSSLDMDAIRAETKRVVGNQMFQHEMEMNAFRPDTRFGQIVDSLLLRLGIDIMA
jgi:hypothetical protein